MPPKDLIIIGAGGHARSVVDVVESGNEYRLKGLVDPTKSIGDMVFDYEVLGTQAELPQVLSEGPCEILIAVGDNFHRHRLYQQITAQIPNAKFATVIHTAAYVSPRASLSAGTVVMAGAIINAGCLVGIGAIINTGAIMEHDSALGDFVSLAPAVAMGGGVKIGDRSSIGLGAKLIHNLNIGQDICVGAGAMVLDDIETDGVVAYGVPSKTIRKRRPNDPYL